MSGVLFCFESTKGVNWGLGLRVSNLVVLEGRRDEPSLQESSEAERFHLQMAGILKRSQRDNVIERTIDLTRWWLRVTPILVLS